TKLLLSLAFSRKCWMVVTLAGERWNTEVSWCCGSLTIQSDTGHLGSDPNHSVEVNLFLMN
ncbi:MAG: hypothetical protein MUP60_00360, partial [Candidatus Thorarchaeota archaeon]|nr:hypothetical protein [Candidatus Thorarchaeota archaeon]